MTVQLIHGDCLNILPTLAAGSVDAVITDPPYCSGGRQQQGARLQITKNDDSVRAPDEWFLSDNMGTDTYVRWMRQVSRECLRLCTMGSHAHVFTDWRQYTNIVTAWESVGWTLRSTIVWDKNRGGAMGSFWRSNHEWICVFTKGQPRRLPNGSYFNTWSGTKPQGGHHPTEKPIGLMRYLVSSIAAESGPARILDPFAGSGTTGVACVLEGKDFVGIEQDESYFALAQKRIAETERQPSLFAQRQAEQLEMGT